VREPSPARRRVARTVAAVAGLARPPAELSTRVRWLLLALGLPTMALLAFVTVVRSPAAWPLLPALGLGGMAAAAALRPRAGGAVLLAAVLAQVPSLTVIATLAYLLGDVLRRQQRVTAREQVLSRVALQGLRAQVALALDRAALTAELAARATVDPLTGLANRALFLERLGQAVASSAADGTTCALVLLDLDDFKTVNDSLGHLRGDGVLVAVAERLRAQLRAGDTAARLGGDEFAVLLERVGGVRDALAVAERLAAELRKPVAVAGREVQARASVGVRLAAGGDPDELLRDADLAMYAAKRTGHGTVRLFDAAMHERALLRLDFEAALRRAVLEQQFTVRYQPVCELAGGGVVGLEALVRWDHPEPGPGDARRVRRHGRGGRPDRPHRPLGAARGLPGGPRLAAPLPAGAAAVHRRQPVAAPAAAPRPGPGRGRRRRRRRAGPSRPGPRADRERAGARRRGDHPAAAELRALGVHLAVDDFGTGYSSLAYLRRLPVDALKLAGAFVEGLTADAEQAALAQAVMRLADTLALQVVAEEVEEADQLRALQALGRRYGQGYLFARPLDQFAVDALLDAGQRRHAQRPAAAPTASR
jgi:diguanylate cyclase (GGDEF)-like protein